MCHTTHLILNYFIEVLQRGYVTGIHWYGKNIFMRFCMLCYDKDPMFFVVVRTKKMVFKGLFFGSKRFFFNFVFENAILF